MEKLRLLALSGSLRKDSYNTTLINTITTLVSKNIEILRFDLSTLPLFNPDREDENIESVNLLKEKVGCCHGVLIASPEYAHGISGVMKNALDWLVSSEEFPYKPVVLCNASPRATHGYDTLKEVINTMSGIIVEDAAITLPMLGLDLTENDIIQNKELSNHIIDKISFFTDYIKNS